MDTSQPSSRSGAQNAVDGARVDRLSQDYEMRGVIESRPSFDFSIRSWDELSRLSNARLKDDTTGDGVGRKPATNYSGDTQCSTRSDPIPCEPADSLLRPERTELYSTGNHTRQGSTTTTQTSILQWWQEYILMLISVGILITVVLVLRTYTNNPQPDWKFGLNLSTLIAILATLLRSSLMSIVEEGTSTRPLYTWRIS
jgi:hypothetical protein